MSARAWLLTVAISFLPVVALAADPAARLVHVSGSGLVQVQPDQVVIDLTVTTTDDDLIRVRDSSDKDARTILALAKRHGVADGGFEVSRLELTLDFNEQLRRQIYEVQRDVTLRLHDLTGLNALLSDLLAERSLKVGGINFVSSRGRQHELEALNRAVADAKEKAAHLAQLNGFSLGDARDIQVIHQSQRPFVTSVIPVVGATDPSRTRFLPGGFFGGAQEIGKPGVRFVAFQPPQDAPAVGQQPFALGMIEVTADVHIDFELVKPVAE